MRTPVLLLLAFAAFITAVPLEDDFGVEKKYPRYIEFPDAENHVHVVDLEAEPDWEFLSTVQRNPANNGYFLYTRQNQNQAQTLTMNNPNSILNSNYNPNRPTIVIVHGWLSNHNTEPNPVRSGLDPAGPLWDTNSNRLNRNDGVYVEAIHTDGGMTGLGFGSAVADADFFPNGGNSQPGCLTSMCNHIRAWELFASTITRDHLVGNRCTSTLQISTNSCRGDILNMGNDDLRKTGNGLFRVNTARSYPF